MSTVVTGRLINVYSEKDLILAFLYRASAIQFGVAGLEEAQGVKGVENVNVSDLVSGHLRYQYLVGAILEKIGFEDVDIDEVAKEEETLALMDEQDKQERKKKDSGSVDLEAEAADMEKEVKRKQILQ
jgi:hypothetical protein